MQHELGASHVVLRIGVVTVQHVAIPTHLKTGLCMAGDPFPLIFDADQIRRPLRHQRFAGIYTLVGLVEDNICGNLRNSLP
jgi:hypothetical protein